MPLALLALLGLGVFLWEKKRAAEAAPSDALFVPVLFIAPGGAPPNGMNVATKDGFAYAMQRLVRYAQPSAPIAGLGGTMGTVKLVFKGPLGKPATEPSNLNQTAAGWVRDQFLAAQYVLVRDTFMRIVPTPTDSSNLPATTEVLAIDPKEGVPASVQLASLVAQGKGWILLDPDATKMAATANTWPEGVADFLSLG